ncbi:MAG: hypothetical protein KatS3mg114_1228 [Planctomycetaceae bacterium]|nr:MAG: hypothetical protein KatS3mg114_1228 [Planctomycetaceae bacterium]
MSRGVLTAGLLVVMVVVLGCGSGGPQGPPRKQTFKVTGKVTVDGQAPTMPIQVTCHVLSGNDPSNPFVPTIEVKPDGALVFGTYVAGDGLPPGEYALTFSSREFNLMKREYDGADLFKGRYSQLNQAPVKFAVSNQPVDIGTVDLTTK